jgi:hypothetical protein
MTTRRSLFALLCGLPRRGSGAPSPAALARHPDKTSCFLFRGRPVVLIGSTEHYGAVLNGDFDYVPYLNELQRHGLNVSRLFTFYRELEGSIKGLGYANTLAPKPGREVLPWKRTGPGKANDGGLKFDLEQWNAAYFLRLKDFVREAGRRGIIVEIVLFCHPYSHSGQWSWFPFHRDNNINGAGETITLVHQFMEQHEPRLFEFQAALARKMAAELNEFDNIYFEICNETSTPGGARDGVERQAAWHRALARVIRETERPLAKKHLIAVNMHQRIPAYEEDGARYTETGESAHIGDALIDILNVHYISRKTPGRGLAVLDRDPAKPGCVWSWMKARRHVRQPFVFDENDAGIAGGDPPFWDRNRMEAWETILSGVAGFNHLDWSFTPQDPAGAGRAPIGDGRRLDGRTLRAQLGVLAKLWGECGPGRMAPDDALIAATPPFCAAFAASSTDRKRHVVYVADSRPDAAGSGAPLRGELVLRAPRPRYQVKMLPSGSVKWKDAPSVGPAGGALQIELPEFRQDCALVLDATAPS